MRVAIGIAAGATLLLVACSGKEPAPLSAELAREYTDLIALIDAADRAALEDNQRQWLKHREDYCGVFDRVADGATPNGPANCRSTLDETRLKELRQLHRAARVRTKPESGVRQEPRRSDEPVTLESDKPISALALLPGSSLFATATQTTVVVRERSTGKVVRSFEAQSGPNSVPITRLAGSAQGRLLATGTTRSPLIKVWDPAAGVAVGDLDSGSNSARLLFAGGGEFLATGPANLQVFNVTTGTRQEGIYETAPTPSVLAADGNERFFAAGTQSGTVELFSQEVRDGRLILRPIGKQAPFKRGDDVVGLSFSRDADSLIAVSRGGEIRRYSVPNMNELDTLASGYKFVGGFSATPDHSLVFLSGSTAETGLVRASIRVLNLAEKTWKQLIPETRTNGPPLEFDGANQQLIVADAFVIRLLPVPQDAKTFAALQTDKEGRLGEVVSTTATPPPPSNTMLPGISPAAVVYAVGVYQGALPGGVKRGFQQSPEGTVEITVGGVGPVILVLSAYEPVRWKVKSAGAVIEQILTFGYKQQTVEAPRSAKVLTDALGDRIYAYERSGSKYPQLLAKVKALTGKDIAIFQGKYEAASFLINVSGGSPPANAIRRYVDENGVVTFEDASRPRSGPPQ